MKTLISYITGYNDLNNGQMKKNDIRIGNNLLLYGEVVKVTEIGFKNDDYYLRIEGNKNGYYIDQFEPTELTEDILLDKGFKKRGQFWLDLYLDEITKLTLSWYVDGRIDFEMSINKICFDISHIKYLHQLQNLYFTLTNKEL